MLRQKQQRDGGGEQGDWQDGGQGAADLFRDVGARRHARYLRLRRRRGAGPGDRPGDARQPDDFLDTSRIYGFGRSEERIGEVIRELGGWPEGRVLSTKLDRDLETGRFDAAPARRSFEESLAALGLDRVHLLHLHDPEHSADLAEIAGPGGALAELFKIKEEGLADAVGLAAGRVDVMMPLLRDWDFDVLITHNRFTLVNRNAEPMIELAVERASRSSTPRPTPAASSPRARPPIRATSTRRRPKRCSTRSGGSRRSAPAHDVPLGAAALQFSMRDPRIASTICGVSRPERVAETLEWADWPIPPRPWDELLALPFATDDPEATRDYKPRLSGNARGGEPGLDLGHGDGAGRQPVAGHAGAEPGEIAVGRHRHAVQPAEQHDLAVEIVGLDRPGAAGEALRRRSAGAADPGNRQLAHQRVPARVVAADVAPGDPGGRQRRLALGAQQAAEPPVVGTRTERGLDDVAEVEQQLAVLARHHLGGDERADVRRLRAPGPARRHRSSLPSG